MVADDRFLDYGHGTYHCRACHRVVTTWDSDDLADQRSYLDAHVAFNCRSDPGEALNSNRSGA